MGQYKDFPPENRRIRSKSFPMTDSFNFVEKLRWGLMTRSFFPFGLKIVSITLTYLVQFLGYTPSYSMLSFNRKEYRNGKPN